jgi:ATP-dependent DNA ligase
MLAKLADTLPPQTDGDDGFLYEPKWDGFRALVFVDDGEAYVQSRDMKPFNRYFPELDAPLAAQIPNGTVVDGEIVIVRAGVLDFEAMLLRIHPAKSRVAKLAEETPASFVAFDLLALRGEDVRGRPMALRRKLLEETLGDATPPIHLTPATTDRAIAADWFERFEGAGLDGVVAKAKTLTYQPDKRVMMKIKHKRTADCVVAGFRWYKDSAPREDGTGGLVGSLLLGLYDDKGTLQHVGVTSTFTRDKRAALARELAPLRAESLEGHPWRAWAEIPEAELRRMPGAQSRWNRGKDLSWQPLRIERVCEVAYDHLQGSRFRHATVFQRWRPDKSPADCRYDQLDVTPPFELAKIFGGDARVTAP